jgi:murein DD-endopeptidase MepM/ murein hydrolase activator NlpD
VKGFFRFSIALMTAPLLCGAALVVGYVMIVVITIPQLPAWAQPGVEQWLFDVPQYAETSDNGSYGNSTPAGMSAVPWDGYVGLGAEIYGLPMVGPIQHWSEWYDRPLLGCTFQDPHYQTHTGSDFPVNEGTSVHATVGGKVVWAGSNGPWGNLVVIENNGYQVWLAHLSSIQVSEGQIINYGDLVGLSGNTGNSSGAHVHYGIKHKTGEKSYAWLNPQSFFTVDEYISIGCSD